MKLLQSIGLFMKLLTKLRFIYEKKGPFQVMHFLSVKLLLEFFSKTLTLNKHF